VVGKLFKSDLSGTCLLYQLQVGTTHVQMPIHMQRHRSCSSYSDFSHNTFLARNEEWSSMCCNESLWIKLVSSTLQTLQDGRKQSY